MEYVVFTLGALVGLYYSYLAVRELMNDWKDLFYSSHKGEH